MSLAGCRLLPADAVSLAVSGPKFRADETQTKSAFKGRFEKLAAPSS